MKIDIKSKEWWGAPKKFSTRFEERKISWLELFYDLVYVIAIAKITHHLSQQVGLPALLEYVYFFVMIFWGWLNGSLYHDLHASSGLRTRLMTLWQMLIVAALVVTIDSHSEYTVRNITIVIMIMQVYITYLWWSVGIYDKYHRILNRPYTIIYLLSFVLMLITLYLNPPYRNLVFYITLLLNYLPPFIVNKNLNQRSIPLSLSSSMSERLGLFTIIIFGEVMSGVVNGISSLHHLNFIIWLNFSLSVFIVFALWWIFFTLVSDRKCKPGLTNSSLLEILYIPTLIALGLMGMACGGMFEKYDRSVINFLSFKSIFGWSLGLFLLGINLMIFFLEFPSQYKRLIQRVQLILSLTIFLILLITIIHLNVSLSIYLALILAVILLGILLLNVGWYSMNPTGEAVNSEA